MTHQLSPTETAALIVRRDRAFKAIAAHVGPPPAPRRVRVDERFATLVRSITFQLLATKAATTIHRRVAEICGGHVSVESVLAAGTGRLREAGLSGTKAAAMVDLAEHVADGRVRLEAHGRMSDDAVTREVTRVHGIGPWTAEMYLMFTLGRPDVWPVLDLGVRRGWSQLHGLDKMVSPQELRALGEPFAGVRSGVAWYCWSTADEDAWDN
ncbi:MAG: DNA-3-methyladenine glycosylase 2 family protein [Acidobacteriota bacterium]|nr:DNA-3-methyladenine glycosylase 2 family protein [Acidobacteriota bacterium]